MARVGMMDETSRIYMPVKMPVKRVPMCSRYFLNTRQRASTLIWKIKNGKFNLAAGTPNAAVRANLRELEVLGYFALGQKFLSLFNLLLVVFQLMLIALLHVFLTGFIAGLHVCSRHRAVPLFLPSFNLRGQNCPTLFGEKRTSFLQVGKI